jgi:hypothetical protein
MSAGLTGANWTGHSSMSLAARSLEAAYSLSDDFTTPILFMSLTLEMDQMANIGAEVGRAFTALRWQDQERLEDALRRGLDLFDLTAKVWRGGNLR